MAEGGGLLNRCTVKSCTGGSNPPLSARPSCIFLIPFANHRKQIAWTISASSALSAFSVKLGLWDTFCMTTAGMHDNGGPLSKTLSAPADSGAMICTPLSPA